MANLNVSNKLIVSEGYRLSGMADTNHLQMFLQESPEKFNKVMTMAFASRNIKSNPLLELTEGRGKVKYLQGNTDDWTWSQQITPRPAVVLENIESSATPGIDKTKFKIKLDQDWFSQGESITTDKERIIRISQEVAPYKEGPGWVYTVELLTDNANDYYPTDYLEAGVEYVRMFGTYGENASQSTKLNFDGNIVLKNSLPDMIRVSHDVTGYVQDRVFTVSSYITDVEDPTKTTELSDSKWISRAEVKFWEQVREETENTLFYSRGSNHIKGESGYNVRTNYGFKQQLDWGHVETYNTFSEKLIREFLLDVFFGRVSSKNRDVVLLTGEYGFMLFDDAFKRATNGLLIDTSKVISGSEMNMGYGYQFTQYRMINGGTVTLKHLPSLDTKITNTMRSKKTGYPKESATFYILDLSGEGVDNLWMVRQKDSLHWSYITGTRAPWPLKGSVTSNAKDGYTLIARDRVGLHIEDVSMTGKLVMGEN